LYLVIQLVFGNSTSIRQLERPHIWTLSSMIHLHTWKFAAYVVKVNVSIFVQYPVISLVTVGMVYD